MSRYLRWGVTAERDRPKRPFRDSAIVFAVLAALLVPIALVTGGAIVRAVVVAAIFFVAATGWSWWRWSVRLRRAEQESTEPGAKSP